MSDDVSTLSEEDFHRKNTAVPIKITLTFEDLSEAARDDLKRYVRQRQLAVFATAEWSDGDRSATVKQDGARLVMRTFAPFSRLRVTRRRPRS